MKTRKRILHAARWLALALSPLIFALATLAQSPLADSFDPRTDGYVSSLALQADGKVLLVGAFRTLGGQSRAGIGRLNVDGALDTSFNPEIDGYVSSLALQTDGKTLVGGSFRTQGSRYNIVRLNADGTFDISFNPVQGFNFDSGPIVYCMALQADGKILVGGVFSWLGGQSRDGIARLNADGTLDTSFNPGIGGGVFSLTLQADGKILVGGGFFTLGSRYSIVRLNADGTPEMSFNPPWTGGNVYSLAVQADGKILVGGESYDIVRLNADGTSDMSFNPGACCSVLSLTLQTDGKILVGGNFTTLGGQSRTNIGRLNADGTLDTSFNTAAGGDQGTADNRRGPFLAIQADGKILVGGDFTTLGGQSRNYIGRLDAIDLATQSLTYDGSTLTWMRGGSSPEVWRATFEYLPDGGTSWTKLGAGNRILGGWQLTGVALPTNTSFRARGYTVGGSWFAETIIGSLIIGTQPSSVTANAGTTTAFSVYAGGNGPLRYQWRKDGGDLVDGGKVSGAATANLTLSNVLGDDAGGYSVALSNSAGSVTSAVAMLMVVDPAIYIQSVSGDWNVGDSVTLSVEAIGTTPLSYQWRQDGVDRAGATQSSLALTNLQGSDAGSYDVIVSNVWGCVTNTVALLSVNFALPDSFNPGADSYVYCLALQADGKILVGGGFSTLGGQSRNYLGRLNADGTLDTGFNPGASSSVLSLVLQTDGKILVGGLFDTLGGQSRTHIGRLNADGTLDTTFNPGAGGAYQRVYSMAVQADGKILVGGNFTTLGGQSRTNIGQLNADGMLDTSFTPGAEDYSVLSLLVQADGKILVGGNFSRLGGQSRTNIGRLNADGTLDTSFNPGAGGAYQVVYCMAVQADGKILVGGLFDTLGGQTRNNIGRLDADGTLDTSFTPAVFRQGPNDAYVSSLAVQADGRILVGGVFDTLGGQSRKSIGRLNADGTLDASFNPGAGEVTSFAVQADGKILVGGYFWALGSQIRSSIGRLNNTEPATQSLTFDGSTLTWMRGGTSPEVWRTTFEYSPDGGASWTNLGAGIRVHGGWQLTGLTLPANTTFRARGYAVGGSWFVETVLRPALAISSAFYLANGQFGFTLTGTAGQSVIVEASTDLVSWLPIWTNTLQGPLHFSDPQSGVHSQRYYRVLIR